MSIFPTRWRIWILTCAWATLLLAVCSPVSAPVATKASVVKAKSSHETPWIAAPAGLEELKAGNRRPPPPRAEGLPPWMAAAGVLTVRPGWSNGVGSPPPVPRPQPASARRPSLVGTVELRV